MEAVISDQKLTALGAVTPALSDILYIVRDPGGTPVSGKVSLTAVRDLIVTFSGARLSKGGVAQSIGSGAFTTLTFGTTTYDTGGIVSTSKFVVPSGWTKALLTSRVIWASGTGRRLVQITKTGSSIAGDAIGDVTTDTAEHGCHVEIDCVAGDEFLVRVFQDSGAALDVTDASFTISKRG